MTMRTIVPYTLCFLVYVTSHTAFARERTEASPAAPATCAIGVAAIVPIDSADLASSDGRAYAAVLASPRGPGAATGRLWINTSEGAFRVSFAHRGVLPESLEGEIDPIAFRLPANSRVENAFVSDLAQSGKSGNAACAIFDPWSHASTRVVVEDRLRHFTDTPRSAITDAQIIAEPDAECEAPNLPARTLHAASPAIPPIAQQQGITGVVAILVRLDVTGDVVGTQLVSSPSELLVSSALTAASTSTFRTAIARCRPIAATYMFHVEFEASR